LPLPLPLPLPPGTFPQSFPVALELRRVGADRKSRALADADATEPQGDGEALGGNASRRREEKTDRARGRGRKKGRGKTQSGWSSVFLFFKKKKWDGYERSEYQGKRRRGAATAVPLRSTAALFGSSPGILSKTAPWRIPDSDLSLKKWQATGGPMGRAESRSCVRIEV